jgi:flagellar basal body-associated protein FliL
MATNTVAIVIIILIVVIVVVFFLVFGLLLLTKKSIFTPYDYAKYPLPNGYQLYGKLKPLTAQEKSDRAALKAQLPPA